MTTHPHFPISTPPWLEDASEKNAEAFNKFVRATLDYLHTGGTAAYLAKQDAWAEYQERRGWLDECERCAERGEVPFGVTPEPE